MLALIGKKMFHGTEQVRTKVSTGWIDCLESTSRQQPCEELLGQLTGYILVPSFALKKAKHRLPICLAQLAKRCLGLGRFPPRTQDKRPGRQGEVAGWRIGSSGCHGYLSLSPA